MARGRVVEPPPAVTTTVTTKKQIIDSETPPAVQSPESKMPPLDDFMRAMKIEELPDYAFYLYRLDPNVVTREGYQYLIKIEAQDFNLMDFSDFTESLKHWMVTKANHGKGYGGGRFQLRVNYRKTGDSYYKEPVTIEGAPVTSERELVVGGSAAPQAAPAGAGSSTQDDAVKAVAVKFLEQQIDEIRKKTIDPAVAVQQVMTMMKEASDKQLEMVMSQVPKAVDPLTQLTNMMTMLDKLGYGKPATPPPDPHAQFLSTITTLKELGWKAPNETEKRSGLSDLKESLEMLKTMREAGMIADSAVSEGPSMWPGLIAQALEKLPLIVAQVKNLSSPTTPAFGPIPAMPAPVAAMPTPAGISGSQPPPPASAAPPPPQTMDPGTFIRVKLVEFFLKEIKGDRVAEWLDMADPPTAAQLSVLTPKIIIDQVIAVDPILKQMHGHPKLPAFIDDFLSYWKPEDEAQDKPAPTAA